MITLSRREKRLPRKKKKEEEGEKNPDRVTTFQLAKSQCPEQFRKRKKGELSRVEGKGGARELMKRGRHPPLRKRGEETRKQRGEKRGEFGINKQMEFSNSVIRAPEGGTGPCPSQREKKGSRFTSPREKGKKEKEPSSKFS